MTKIATKEHITLIGVSQRKILAALKSKDASLSSTEIIRANPNSPFTSIYKQLKTLHEKGYVKFKKPKNNNKPRIYSSTKLGRKLLQITEPSDDGKAVNYKLRIGRMEHTLLSAMENTETKLSAKDLVSKVNSSTNSNIYRSLDSLIDKHYVKSKKISKKNSNQPPILYSLTKQGKEVLKIANLVK